MSRRATLVLCPPPGGPLQAAEPLCPPWVQRDLARWAPALAHAAAKLTRPRTPALQAASEPYARTVLHRSGAGELMLACWRPGAQCAIHDHGGGHGRVYLLRGGVHEQRWVDEAAVRAGQPPAVRVLGAGEYLQVDTAVFHAMRSDEHPSTLTLHAYVNAAAPVRIALPQQRATLAVAADHGAWAPSPEAVLEEEAWANG